jgi:hypothetical protein
MLSGRDISAAAVLIVKRCKSDAMLDVAARADELQEDGDWEHARSKLHLRQ